MHTDRIRERALEVQPGTAPDADVPAVADPDNAPPPASKGAKPPLSQIERERADDEGMVRQDHE